MDKVKISEVAKELGKTNKEVIEKAKDLLIVVKSPQSSVTMEQAGVISNYLISGEIPSDIKAKIDAEKAKKVEKPKSTPPQAKVEKAEESKTEPKATAKVVAKQTTQEAPQEKLQEKSQTVEPDRDKQSPQSVQEDTPSKPTLSVKKSKQVQVAIKQEEPVAPKPKTEKKKKQPPKKPINTVAIKAKLDFNAGFRSDVDLDEVSSSMLMPDFDVKEDVLKKLEKTNNLISKTNQANQVNKNAGEVKRVNPFAKTNTGSPEKRTRKKTRYKNRNQEGNAKVYKISADSRVHEFAQKTAYPEGQIFDELEALGLEVGKNDFLESDHIELLADALGIEVQIVSSELEELDYVKEYDNIKDDKHLQTRPPVVTIMGHVDHGKTSLLDAIRQTKITAGEAGGITQHIGAYKVKYGGRYITFIDTPGHAAFDGMRERGAKITDVIIVVVAADEGVKDQTLESINHAKASGAPIIVAVTKIDKPEINVDLIKTQMAEHELMASDWGGEIDFIEVSAHTKQGLDELLETINVQAELLECKTDPKAFAKAVVIESTLETGRGSTASLILQDGCLSVGDNVILDTVHGRVRSMIDDDGKSIQKAYAGDPVQIAGLNDIAPIGSVLVAMKDAKEVKELAQKRSAYKREREMSKTTKVSIEDLTSMISENKLNALPVIVKADFNGSLEAIKAQLDALKNEEVKVNIVSSGIGGITDKDLDLAGATENCLVLGFNVRPTGAIKQKADRNGITISTYSIIYELLDEVKHLLGGLMSPVTKQENTGQAEVRDVFKTPKGIAVAGCMVSDGKVVKGGLARVIREGVVICDNSVISSLKRFKDDVKEVTKGYECGIIIENYNEVKTGDVIETFIEKQERQVLS